MNETTDNSYKDSEGNVITAELASVITLREQTAKQAELDAKVDAGPVDPNQSINDRIKNYKNASSVSPDPYKKLENKPSWMKDKIMEDAMSQCRSNDPDELLHYLTIATADLDMPEVDEREVAEAKLKTESFNHNEILQGLDYTVKQEIMTSIMGSGNTGEKLTAQQFTDSLAKELKARELI